MYALKFYSMFIRASDGHCTDNKASAILFDTVDEAKAYVASWRTTSGVHHAPTDKVSIIEVETKRVIQKVGKEVEVV